MKTLPFASYAEPTLGYPEALELATVLLTVESRRSKGTGLLLMRKASEGIGWVSRFVWPMLGVPVTFPAAGAAAAGEGSGEYAAPRALFFDLTGLISSSAPGFQAREGLDELGVGAGRPTAAEFTAMLERRRDGLRQAKKPILGKLTGLIRRGTSGEEIAGFVSGNKQLAKDLAEHLAAPEAPDWTGTELPRQVSPEDAANVARELDERIRAYQEQASKIDALLARISEDCSTYGPEVAAAKEAVAQKYNADIAVLQPDVDRRTGELQSALEEKLNAINTQFAGTITQLEAEVSRVQHDEDRFRGLGKGYEAQLADARRARAQAQRNLETNSRERDGSVKQARDQFRSLIDQENEKVNSLIKARDREVNVYTEQEQKLGQALRDFTAAGEAAAKKDRDVAAEIASLAQEAPGVDGGEALEFGVPFYVARLDAQRSRYVPLVPMNLKRQKSVTQVVTGFLGATGLLGLTLPSEPRTPRYEQVLGRALTAALEGGAAAGAAEAAVGSALNASAPATNVLARPELKGLALEGLQALREGKWLNDKQTEEQRQALERMFG